MEPPVSNPRDEIQASAFDSTAMGMRALGTRVAMGISHHLAILLPTYIDAVLAGKKRMECRLGRVRALPHGRVWKGDHLWLKESAGPIRAHARAGDVLFFEQLTPRGIAELKGRYNHLILGTDDFWLSRLKCRYMTLVALEDVRPVGPIRFEKSDRRPWVLLSARQHRALLHQARSGPPPV